MHTAGSTHVAVLAAASALSPTIPLSLQPRATHSSWEQDQTWPAPPSPILFSTLSLTHSRQYQQVFAVKAKNRQQTSETKEVGCTTHTVSCVYQLKDEATLDWMKCVTERLYIYVSVFLFICCYLITLSIEITESSVYKRTLSFWLYSRLHIVASWSPCGSTQHNVNHSIRLAWHLTLYNRLLIFLSLSMHKDNASYSSLIP